MEDNPEAFKKVKFVSSSEAVKHKTEITRRGGGQARLKSMK